MTRNSVCCISYLRNHTSCDCHLCYTFVKWYLQVWCSFFQNFVFFWSIGGVKGKKMVQNDKNFCLLRSISQEPYITWLSFMVQMCEMITSPNVFFNLKILIFRVVRGLKGQNRVQNDKKFCLSHSGTVHHMIVIFGTHV